MDRNFLETWIFAADAKVETARNANLPTLDLESDANVARAMLRDLEREQSAQALSAVYNGPMTESSTEPAGP